jgi:hypothetical protein
MDSETIVRLQAAHDEAFERYLVAERALRIAQHLDGDPTPIRLRRNDLRHIAAGYAEMVENARRESQ